MNLQFYAAGTDDIDAILQMQQDFYAIDQYNFDKQAAKEALRVFLDNANYGKLWLIMYNGQLAGYVALTLGYSFEFKGRDAFLDELYVLPEHRGNGLGTKAVEFVAEKAREMGVKAIHLEVEAHNEAGRALYRNFDFQDHNRILMTRWL
ncbi:MAG TPA: GNAT family N-acetyltransferase [Saprospiraceae bacterium]|nr:GNAT family N-acetyltransferase [Saprospiraceae bacterium]HMP25955.1 GNAT family N-acetyltransferase [Saprospiraceae bacterium]